MSLFWPLLILAEQSRKKKIYFERFTYFYTKIQFFKMHNQMVTARQIYGSHLES
jgi:hypothetical protein